MPAPKDPQKYDEWRRKRSEARKRQPSPMTGKKHSDEAKEKMRAAKVGKPPAIAGKHHSDEAKAKMSAAKKGKPNWRKGVTGGSSWNKGIPCSEEQKNVISAANKGRVPSPEEIERMAATKRGVPLSEEHKRSLSRVNKGRIPPVTGKKFTGEEYERKYRNVIGNTWSRGRKMPDHVREILIQSRRKGKNVDTSIERIVAARLDKAGIIYEKQKRVGKYAVDFFIPEDNLLIEVNGCYWHGCEQCGFNHDWHPERRERDRLRTAYLVSCGYNVQIIWGHELEGIDEQKQT